MNPTPKQAEEIFLAAKAENGGPWVNHSRFAAHVARLIARHHPAMEEEVGYVLGLLHDVGRKKKHAAMAHITEGYYHLTNLGYPLCARIAMTHSFPIPEVESSASGWIGWEKEKEFTRNYLDGIVFDSYDKLIQLSDSIGGIYGIVPMEVRLVDIALRHGTNEFTTAKWKALFQIKSDFEQEIGSDLYQLLAIPGDKPFIPSELIDLLD
jgi:hypothetical protein